MRIDLSVWSIDFDAWRFATLLAACDTKNGRRHDAAHQFDLSHHPSIGLSQRYYSYKRPVNLANGFTGRFVSLDAPHHPYDEC